jgi:hypothetical protein
MLTLIGTLLGAGMNFLPTLIAYFQKKQDNAHELALTELSYQAKKEGLVIDYNTQLVKADTDEGNSVRTHDSSVDGGKFVNAFRAAIRPFITVLFFLAFIAFKASIVYLLLTRDGMILAEVAQTVWDSETSAIFGTIMAFWFGNRMLNKYSKVLSS